MKIAKSTWDKYSPSEQKFFQKCIPTATGVREIKAFISGIKKQFGSVENVFLVKVSVVTNNGDYYCWMPGDKRWVKLDIDK